MKKINFSKLLYLFLFSNTFIAGLFNFLIPLYLLDNGFSFSEISLFIALNSLAFFLFLFVIEYLIKKLSISYLTSLTFVVYASYLSTIFFLQSQHYFIIVLSILSGIYLSLFWILQRFFFLETITHNNAGRKFGNIQIFVGFSTLLAIFLGSYLLEFHNFRVIYIISMISLFFVIILTFLKKSPHTFDAVDRNSLKEIVKFKDNKNSKLIFLIDGVFLSLESYFWLMIIFIFTQGNFFEVGKIISLLALLFFISYYLIKNKIDTINLRTVFTVSTILYSISWLLRYIFILQNNLIIQYTLIYTIGFMTLFFRLVFNKIFFEHAKKTSKTKYILLKSYYSQFIAFITFLIISVAFLIIENSKLVFITLFLLSSILSFIYLLYSRRN